MVLTTEEFIKRAKNIHKKYDYSKVKYINAKTKVKIICPKHGEFEQTPISHLYRGSGCKKCGYERTTNARRKSKEEFLKQAKTIHNNYYDYSQINFIDYNTKITIICQRHGKFQQTPTKHITGQGCRKCMKYKLRSFFKLSKEEFIKRSRQTHGDKYDYSKVKYVNAHKKVIIICPKHGEFQQEPNSHMRENGCPSCAHNRKSRKASKWLSNFNIEEEKIIRINGKLFIVDGFDSKNNIIYEYYGNFWHGNPNVFNLNDLNTKTGETFGDLYNKTIKRAEKLINDGYGLIYKWETDYDMGIGVKYEE